MVGQEGLRGGLRRVGRVGQFGGAMGGASGGGAGGVSGGGGGDGGGGGGGFDAGVYERIWRKDEAGCSVRLLESDAGVGPSGSQGRSGAAEGAADLVLDRQFIVVEGREAGEEEAGEEEAGEEEVGGEVRHGEAGGGFRQLFAFVDEEGLRGKGGTYDKAEALMKAEGMGGGNVSARVLSQVSPRLRWLDPRLAILEEEERAKDALAVEFLKSVAGTAPMEEARRYISARAADGGLGYTGLGDGEAWETKLFDMWFRYHPLWVGDPGDLSQRRVFGQASGFRHIFCGEGLRTGPGRGTVLGYHNWHKFWLDEAKNGCVTYLGDHKNRKAAIRSNPHFESLEFEWEVAAGVRLAKRKVNMFVGPSPEGLMALGTVAFFETLAEEKNLRRAFLRDGPLEEGEEREYVPAHGWKPRFPGRTDEWVTAGDANRTILGWKYRFYLCRTGSRYLASFFPECRGIDGKPKKVKPPKTKQQKKRPAAEGGDGRRRAPPGALASAAPAVRAPPGRRPLASSLWRLRGKGLPSACRFRPCPPRAALSLAASR